MTYYDPKYMTPHNHEALMAWLQAEGLDAKTISSERFSVHNGWISGYQMLRNDDGTPRMHNGETIKMHFMQRQVHPLPDELL